MKPEELYKYNNNGQCTVILRPVCSDPFEEGTGIVNPTERQLGKAIHHVIHAGYRPCLTAFIREVEFMVKDQDSSRNCLFRGTYLTMVLDRFADELEDRPRLQAKTRFRSKVLNPVLQRLMRGITDYEVSSVRAAVGDTSEGSAALYLGKDPLDKPNRITMLRNSSYVWPVRNSYYFLEKGRVAWGAFKKTLNNTQFLGRECPGDRTAGKLTDAEREVITGERLEGIYREFVAMRVSTPWLSTNFGRFSSKFQDASKDNDPPPPPVPDVDNYGGKEATVVAVAMVVAMVVTAATTAVTAKVARG